MDVPWIPTRSSETTPIFDQLCKALGNIFAETERVKVALAMQRAA